MLSMTRQDIANFLGLTLETVNRTFAGLEKEGVLHIQKRNIQILNKPTYVNLAVQVASRPVLEPISGLLITNHTVAPPPHNDR